MKQGIRRPTIKVKAALKEAGLSKSEKKKLLTELEKRKQTQFENIYKD